MKEYTIEIDEKLTKLAVSKKWCVKESNYNYLFGYNVLGHVIYHIIYPNLIPVWCELLNSDKCTNEQLMDYFIEVIREELPELKGIEIRTSSVRYGDGDYKPIIKQI